MAKKSGPVTVHHPLIPGATRTVAPSTAEAWLAAGWLKSAPDSEQAASAASRPADNKEGEAQ